MYERDSFSNYSMYEHASQIKVLSEHVSQYLNYDLNSLDEQGKEHPGIYLTGDIILHSYFLGDAVLNSEKEVLSENREKYHSITEKWLYRLHKNCERLEKYTCNGKEFVQLLKHEIRKFQILHRKWRTRLY